MRIIGLVFVMGMLVTIAVVYELKYDTEQAALRVAKLHRLMDAEREKISLLNAELSALTEPERMQRLVELFPDHLHYVPVSAEDIIDVGDLPIKPIQMDQFIDRKLSGFVGIFHPEQQTEKSP